MNKNLNICDMVKNIYDNCDGEIHYLKTTGDAFLLAPDHKDIRKVTILTHEFEHVIDCFNNPDFY